MNSLVIGHFIFDLRTWTNDFVSFVSEKKIRYFQILSIVDKKLFYLFVNSTRFVLKIQTVCCI